MRPRTLMIKLLFLCFLVASAAIVQAQGGGAVRLPRPFDSGAPNDCLPAAMRVYHELPGPPTCGWKRILSARYSDGRMHHVYCVFSLGSQIYAYDNYFGSRRVFPADRSSAAVVRAVDFQAAYGVYLDQEQKSKTIVSKTTAYASRTPVKRTGEGRARETASKANAKSRN